MLWTSERDTRLIKLQADGLSGSEIAEIFGTTRNAVIARSNRIRGVVFPADKARRERLVVEFAALERKRLAKQVLTIQQLRQNLKSGMDRRHAIGLARQDGATSVAIAAALGISRQRVSQLAPSLSIE